MITGYEGIKLFDDNNVDERLILHDGDIEDLTQQLGPSNVGRNDGTMIGRDDHIREVLNMILIEKEQLIQIIGSKGIGKTKLVREIAQHIHQHKLIPEGVYFLDFENIKS